ncbi:Fe-regulated protein [Lachnellula suecica]|uniref:Fe-regulated protein n=1 Tax=Lachnellula suecica TaxID=602035 RepID=A0A8T9CCP3_9HELO|nr:Fe-regulated protein [Lachnellula suecica]
MAVEMLRFIAKYLPAILPFAFSLLSERIHAFIHRFTYKSVSAPKNVVVLGGSFAGAWLALRLAESLPTGYKVVLVEKNSHFNYVFNFPRYSVLQHREQRAFIPYDGLMKKAPKGVFERVQDVAVEVRDGEIELASGVCVPYEYLAVATGVRQSGPAKLLASEKSEACAELRTLQGKIQGAKRIAIVGGGPVGVEITADIKTFYPEKTVILIHSRSQLLSNFGKRLHEHVMGKMNDIGVEVLLGERPNLPQVENSEAAELVFKGGRVEHFDLVARDPLQGKEKIIPCTGQTPNSSIIENFLPTAISPKNGQILVKSTLQVHSGPKCGTAFENIFSLGDVAETGGPKMGSAAFVQSGIVEKNILALIHGKELSEYKPMSVEGILKLTLGKDNYVVYAQHEDGSDFLMPGKDSNVDLAVAKAWKTFGADFKDSDV